MYKMLKGITVICIM